MFQLAVALPVDPRQAGLGLPHLSLWLLLLPFSQQLLLDY
jgi:hypothetical protein